MAKLKFRTKGNVSVDTVKTDVKSYCMRSLKKMFVDSGEYTSGEAEKEAKKWWKGTLRYLGKKEGKNIFEFSWDATDLVNVYPGLIRKMQRGKYLVGYERM